MTEKVVALHLLDYLRCNGIEEPYQCAYKHVSTVVKHYLFVQNDILTDIDEIRLLLATIRSISCIRHTADHEILLQRMSSEFAIKGDALNWFRSHLSERSLVVYIHVNSGKSGSYNVGDGVPPGSVLGPILHLIIHFTETFDDRIK